jgi:hypothetical protein
MVVGLIADVGGDMGVSHHSLLETMAGKGFVLPSFQGINRHVPGNSDAQAQLSGLPFHLEFEIIQEGTGLALWCWHSDLTDWQR